MHKSNQARNHHWIPQCYLKGFAKSRSKKAKLFVVDAIAREAFETTPRNVASARDFNRINITGVSPNHIESEMAKFEGNVSQALARMSETRQFGNAEDHNLILNLIALLAVRNPGMRENIRQFDERVVKQLMSLTVATKERYKSSIAQAARAGELQDGEQVSYESMRQFVESGQYRIEVPTTRHVELELYQAESLIPLLGKRSWLLMRAPSSTSGFVTTDHPVVLQWSEQRNRGFFSSPGFGLQGTQVIFPVSHELVMIGVFGGNYGVLDISSDYVAEVNGAVIAHSQRQVYARDNRFQYVGPSGKIRRGMDIQHDIEKK